MKINRYIKYSLRFLFLQSLLTYISIFYFNNYLVSTEYCEFCVDNTYLGQINANLLEDRNRFFSFIPENYININISIGIFIFIFLVILYSTKFYTYVNELSFSLDRSYLDELVSIFLLWSTAFIIFLTMFRVSHLISRGSLLLYTFLVPIFLLLFRNSEYISSALGRSVTNENLITFNLDDDSVFRNLRIFTFRNIIKEFENIDLNKADKIIELIDSENKKNNLNLIVLNFGIKDSIDIVLEEYLINLNKKVLIISKDTVKFNNIFLKREEVVSKYVMTYFNNDIQYGSKYILKRLLDIIVAVMCLVLLSPLFILISLYIRYLDGGPALLKQIRIGLHGKQFNMYKFRTMKKNSHELRKDLEKLNKHDEVIFKIEHDPRIIKGTNILRNLSLDELPQLVNVIKGNMSIVGPRPLFEEDTLLFNERYMRRLNVLPGITGLLQINDRNASEFETWYKYDIEYIENWSLYLDLKIMFKTPFALFSRKIKGL